MSAERAATLHRELGGQLVIEVDRVLTPASLALAVGQQIHDPGVAVPHGAGFDAGFSVRAEGGAPLADATVQLFGQIWSAVGVTDDDGHVDLTIHGESPASIAGLLVTPRADHWSRWIRLPAIEADQDHVVELRALARSLPDAPDEPLIGWGQRMMGLDLVPAEWRGRGVKVAVIDSGAAATHRNLRHISHGFDAVGRTADGWRADAIGHGSHCAGVIAGGGDGGVRGFAPDAELHVCRVSPNGRLSDLIRALDYCLDHGVALVNLSMGSPYASQIVERRIVLAKQRGMAVIAAAGNTAGAVEYPAASPHVLAVAAIGKAGEYPPDSYHALAPAAGDGAETGGVFATRFSCRGPEIDVAAPGVAVVSSAPPDGFAALDGTSVAAAHVTGLAALLLAHHPDFQGAFRMPGAARVERLFQILKATAVRLESGDPACTGAGLPAAARAFGFDLPGAFDRESEVPAGPHSEFALAGLRAALRAAGVLDSGGLGDARWDASWPTSWPLETGAAPVLRGPTITGVGPLAWPGAPGNGAAAPITLETLRGVMAEAALF